MFEKPDLIPYHNVLPDELKNSNIAIAHHFLDSVSLDSLNEWAKQRIQTYDYDNRRFRMVVDRPEHGNDDKSVVVCSDWGTSIIPALIARSRIIRDAVDPNATLVIQPNSILGQPNMNFSSEERRRLFRGDLQPIIGRIALTVGKVGGPKDVTLFGASQGATVALGYASYIETSPVAVAIVEAPNIVNRSIARLALDFMGSGNDLLQVVESNFRDHTTPLATLLESNARRTPNGLGRYITQSLHPDNIFGVLGAMRRASAADAIGDILDKGGSVVHAWGDNQDDVSPDHINRSITKRFESNPQYMSRVLHGMGHTALHFYPVNGVLTRLAHDKIFR